MSQTNDLPLDSFIFNEKNRGFLNGTSRRLGGQGTTERAIKFAALLFISTALPIGILIALIFSIITRLPFMTLFMYQALFMLLLSACLGYLAYRLRNKLEADGKVLVGEVASYDTRPTFSAAGYRNSTRLKYWFLSPTGNIVYGYTLLPPQSLTHLPDGRELPQPGTPVAVLYVDNKKHTIL